MICLINHINVKKNIHALNNLLIHNFKIFEQIFKLTFAHSRWSKSVHLLINQGHHTEHTKFVNINKSKIKSCLVCIFWTLDLILQNRNLEIHDNLSKLYLRYIRYQNIRNMVRILFYFLLIFIPGLVNSRRESLSWYPMLRCFQLWK